MKKLYAIDLSNENISVENYDLNSLEHYGRGLAGYLVEKNVRENTDRFDEDNVIVMVPGLFTGTNVPSTGRIVLATKAKREKGLQINNISGAMAQKLASLDIAAVVIKGKSRDKNAIITINSDGCRISHENDLKDLKVSNTIDYLRNIYGSNSAIVGIGPSGEAQLPLSTTFSTYPEGEPVYYCSRGCFGDIFGSKGLKAIVVQSNNYFKSSVADKESLRVEAKKLGKIIVGDPICGGALPSYGSITLMKMLKDGRNIKFEKKEKKGATKILDKKINRTCAPLCVIGCLNRHSDSHDSMFSSPAESEAYAALKGIFHIDDMTFTKDFNKAAFELGLDSIELIFACALYLKAENITGTKEILIKLLSDVEKLNVTGRVIGSRTQGIYKLYSERSELLPMVSRPSTTEEKNFNVKLTMKKSFNNISDLELLYSKIIMLENLGFCLFSSFALIDNEEALAILKNLYYYTTGVEIEAKQLIDYGLKSLERELDFERRAKGISAQKTIPEFVKVLYRYFDGEN
ncbi:aldehyde ferredoxin oxidoreductase N-terminal domain-containing protein [Proteiniborus sp. MB09-C3]|uniref:aldehyde ferredoxin oxidoreductase N-terminal domain-containing protein n=1 Tax=Proteiniborus sp. MB09-C3 TaxID=3050072 RepID=UPI002553AEEA|nr:aldehyde ferredoxin oxidoreductase N-terminal domain-containing protein [Proteiniborus sp. MB09-C3]WIV12656.1 aldehyde ferredoxin oxidoreductase N-terminal domain-containing protein [Proteiniborus sp. MB09-C3]